MTVWFLTADPSSKRSKACSMPSAPLSSFACISPLSGMRIFSAICSQRLLDSGKPLPSRTMLPPPASSLRVANEAAVQPLPLTAHEMRRLGSCNFRHRRFGLPTESLVQCGFEKLAAGGGGCCEPGFQLVAQRHKFVYLRYDAVLFGCWRIGSGRFFNVV